MFHLLSTISSVFLIQSGISLSIINVTSPIPLTQIFTGQNTSNQYNIDIDMSYFIDSNTSAKYLWYQVLLSKSQSNSLKAAIFTPEFSQYKKNQFPLMIENGDILDTPGMLCTSPTTMDIITCWGNVDVLNYGSIDCKLYNAQHNTLSDIISIKVPSANNYDHYNHRLNVLCFNDSYFVTYWDIIQNEGWDNMSWLFYGTILDLNGIKVHENVVWEELLFSEDTLITFDWFLVKGGNSFDPKIINNNATALFRWYIQTSPIATNENAPTNDHDIYGYYTNINDTTFPIVLYENNSISVSESGFMENYILDWTNTCCYMEMYIPNTWAPENINVRITDTYGHKISIEGYSDSDKYIILLRNISSFTSTNIVDLPMISDSNVHYFMVCVGEGQTFPPVKTNPIECTMFYLEFDVTQNQYQLRDVGQFNTTTTDGAFVTMYNIPDTRYLFFAWEEYYDDNYNNYAIIYGQTWEVY